MRAIFKQMVPFLILGVMIVIFVVGLIIFSYLLIIGAAIGLILFVIAWIRERLIHRKSFEIEKKKKSGRTIDHR